MNQRVRVPIRVKQSNSERRQVDDETKSPVSESEPDVVDHRGAVAGNNRVRVERPAGRPEAEAPQPKQQEEMESLEEDVKMWRDRALRFQAEMENFRKRQRRLAENQIEADRGRLLSNFLMVADDLDRALSAEGGDDGNVREGLEVTQRSLQQLLRQEGVELIEARGEKFDPTWHEAIGTVPHQGVDADRDTVVDVTQPGYRLDGRLLRPARVIVAR